MFFFDPRLIKLWALESELESMNQKLAVLNQRDSLQLIRDEIQAAENSGKSWRTYYLRQRFQALLGLSQHGGKLIPQLMIQNLLQDLNALAQGESLPSISREILDRDWRLAIRGNDEITREALTPILRNINMERNKRGEITDEEILGMLMVHLKRLRAEYDNYQKRGDTQLAESILSEIKIVSSYLPAQLNDLELTSLVDEVIAQLKTQNAESKISLGQVMGALKSLTLGLAENQKIASIAKERLQ